MTKSNPMWGGHYAQGPADAFAAINPSIDVDKALYAHDINGSLAHSEMLAAQGIITAEEQLSIRNGLETIRREIETGEFTFKPELEDIHMNIEARLKALIGDAAGKLHTARSRNDQVATDFRLFVREAVEDADGLLKALQAALIAQAEANTETILPGMTHLQSAQPITLAHHFMAYTEMFARDRARLSDAHTRVNECPLGAAALAGTSFDIDRNATAEKLGFDAPMRNSLDAVSDRDFVLEPLSAFALCAMHLSRLSEELILWCSAPFGFITLPESFTSGSSIMPQKRNPDAAELIRGKAAAIAAAQQQVWMMMKALPLAYNKDTQEDKAPFFRAYDDVRMCVLAMTGMIEGLTPNKARMQDAAAAGFSTATDLADWLVRELGMPFRDAHHVTGAIVRMAEAKGCRLDELSLEEMQSAEPRMTKAVFEVLSVEASVASRTSFGGTSPVRVKEAIEEAKTLWL
jgi:argininosuccinate lyase